MKRAALTFLAAFAIVCIAVGAALMLGWHLR